MPSLKLQEIDYSDDLIRIYASIKSRRSKCPSCGRHSKREYDFYTRIAHGHHVMEITQPKVLGVDDWAYRKGVSYGTILIDMETSRPIELLPSRDGQVLKEWLLKYNDVKIVTRD